MRYAMRQSSATAIPTMAAIQVPTKEELKALPQPIQPRELPPIYVSLQQSYDEYQKLINDPKTAPQMALNAGIISMAHLRIDEAIQRFEVVLQRFDVERAGRLAVGGGDRGRPAGCVALVLDAGLHA